MNELKNREGYILILCRWTYGDQGSDRGGISRTEYQLYRPYGRNTLKYVSDKDKKGFEGSETIYKALSEQAGREALDEVKGNGGEVSRAMKLVR